MERASDDKQTLFNAGLAKLERIHNIRMGIHEARMALRFDLWAQALQSLRSEINERLNDDERKKCNTHHTMMGKVIDIWLLYTRDKNKVKVKPRPYNVLYTYELYLNDLEFRYGMSLPDKADPRKAISLTE